MASLPVLRKTGWNPPDPVAQAMMLEMLEARRIAEAEDRALLHAALTGQPRPQGGK